MTWDTLILGVSSLIATIVVISILWQDREYFMTWMCEIMSRQTTNPTPSPLVRSHPDAIGPQTDAQTESTNGSSDAADSPSRQVALREVLRALRAAGVDRQEARRLLAALGGGKIGFSNEVWADAAPPVIPSPVAYTPIGQTPYDPSRYAPRSDADETASAAQSSRPGDNGARDDRAGAHE